MPTVKQLQNAKKKLKKTAKPTGNTPKIPTSTLLRLIAADPKIRRNREFMKMVQELSKKK
jgi:hypothetical protein